jgi:hypothetical protein
MAHLRYDIVPQSGGWSIAMGGATGPPYLRFEQALLDVKHIAKLLAATGDRIDIVAWRGGSPHLLESHPPIAEHSARS